MPNCTLTRFALRLAALLPVAAGALLIPAMTAPAQAASSGDVWHAFEVGRYQKGDPYRYGAAGPGAFDCSGLTSYAYHRAGISLPRTSSDQAGAVRHIKRRNLRKGDLVFFTDNGRVYHVGLFAGRHDGRTYVLHSPYSGARVRVDPIWTSSWFGGTKRPR